MSFPQKYYIFFVMGDFTLRLLKNTEKIILRLCVLSLCFYNIKKTNLSKNHVLAFISNYN